LEQLSEDETQVQSHPGPSFIGNADHLIYIILVKDYYIILYAIYKRVIKSLSLLASSVLVVISVREGVHFCTYLSHGDDLHKEEVLPAT
jgi:hypothetical protein